MKKSEVISYLPIELTIKTDQSDLYTDTQLIPWFGLAHSHLSLFFIIQRLKFSGHQSQTEKTEVQTVCVEGGSYLVSLGLFRTWTGNYQMSRDARKPVFRVSDQVRHKPGCTITEDG